jgi:hypothetical protein
MTLKLEYGQRFTYESLSDSHNIRLLRLSPSLFGGPLHATLEQRHVDEPGKYEALSYCWGDANDCVDIFINRRPIRVTRNCAEALEHLRNRTVVRTLWVDAVCIDQSSNDEKALQIPLMGQIYESAEQVLVWLGIADPENHARISRLKLEKYFIAAANSDLNKPFETPGRYIQGVFGQMISRSAEALRMCSLIGISLINQPFS